MPLSRLTRSSAATIGQKAASTLTDRPGINCKSVMLPTHQNGTDSPKTSRKNGSGDLLRKALPLNRQGKSDDARAEKHVEPLGHVDRVVG